MATIQDLIPRMRTLQVRHLQANALPAWHLLHRSPAWRLIRTPAWSLSHSTAAQLRSAVQRSVPPPAVESLRYWSVLQQRIRTTLSMLSEFQPPVLPAARLTATVQIMEAFSGERFAQLSRDLPAPTAEDDDEIQALLDKFSAALADE
jgi:hypothetical protein